MFVSWVNIFQPLGFFQSFKAFIDLIIQSIADVKYFILLFALLTLACINAVYFKQKVHHDLDPDSKMLGYLETGRIIAF